MRKTFVFNPDKHFLGEPCRYGHKGYRFKSSPGVCCECNDYESRIEYQREYQRGKGARPEGLAVRIFLQCRARQRKKNPNSPFTLTKEWILEKIKAGYCEVTKLPFNLEFGSTSRRPFAPSVDKINPRGNYTIENCQMVCFIYNVAKGEFHHEDVCKLARAIVNGICK